MRSFTYDNLGRPASDVLRNSAGQTVASTGYSYDLDDHLTRKTTTGTAGAGDNRYTYDQADRLTSRTVGAKTAQYGWDAAGNRTQAGSETATFDQRNRLQSQGDTTYSYTPRGTLASKASSGLTERFSFDAFDRLISEGSQSYAHDGLDRLASHNGAAFAYSGQDDEVVADGTAKYARGAADELLAIAEGQGQLDKRLALADEHGDVVGDFDPANTTLSALNDSTAYDPFGEVTVSSGVQSNLGFQGDWTDPATDQVDMGARWYDPGSGAFDSRDAVTYGAGASILADRYTYAAGDPLDTSTWTATGPPAAGAGRSRTRSPARSARPPATCGLGSPRRRAGRGPGSGRWHTTHGQGSRPRRAPSPRRPAGSTTRPGRSCTRLAGR